ncbi:MAG TPA: DUF4352 domain-containing protein, partial [Thermomicrobiales bacterium]|nr:DUF4352 domain-containing protein [Thermomicrobiales bacterium]
MKQHRSSTVRTLLSLLTAFVMMLGTTSAIFAQATPEATPGASGDVGPALGDAVVIVDANGDPMLQIAVTDMVDPDKAISGGDRGFHYVSLQVVVQNTSAADVDFNAYSITVVDAEGFIYNPTYANRESDDYTARPDFSETTVPAGGSISGWLFYQVINDATPAWIVYSASFTTQQFAVLANLQGVAIGSGDPVTFYDADAAEAGTVTVNNIISDFQKVDSSVTVDRGSTIVAIDVTVENTSDVDMASSPTFYLVDDFGFQYYQTYSFRSDAETSQYPDFPSDPIAAGASATGVVLFQIAKGAEISYITFQPDYQQLYIIAQPGEGSVVSGDTLTPVAVSTDDSGDTDTTDDTTDDRGSTGTETGDCVGVNDWVGEVNDA